MDNILRTEERIEVVIGSRTYYKVQQTTIDTSRPPAPTKHQVRTRNKIKRPITRGLDIQNPNYHPYSTSHCSIQPSGPLRPTAPTTTRTHYDADTLGLERTRSHIER